jgi:hypothetical protein
MLELIILAFVFYVGYNLGQIVLSWHLRDIIVRDARKEGIRVDSDYNIIEDGQPNVFQLFVESVNDILYLYEREKNVFICQATSMEELAELSLKNSNIKYAAVLHGEQVVAFVNGKVKITV